MSHLDAAGPRPPQNAPDHVTRRVPIARPDDLVADVLADMRGREFDSAAAVVVLEGERLVGLVSIDHVLTAEPDTPIRLLVDSAPPTVSPATDREKAAWKAVESRTHAVAVADRGRFVGLIPAEALVSILSAEHDEDMVRLGGFLNTESSAQTTTVEPIHKRLWHRLPWLVMGLVGALLAAGVVGTFEASLSETVLIAFFVPGVVYLADAVGTQTEALVIRGLAVGVSIRRIALREVFTGLILGIILGLSALVLVGTIWHDWDVVLAVGISIFAASSIATAIALVLPWIIDRMGKDPAFGSGPLATVIQDLLTVAIYLGAATLLTR